MQFKTLALKSPNSRCKTSIENFGKIILQSHMIKLIDQKNLEFELEEEVDADKRGPYNWQSEV